MAFQNLRLPLIPEIKYKFRQVSKVSTTRPRILMKQGLKENERLTATGQLWEICCQPESQHRLHSQILFLNFNSAVSPTMLKCCVGSRKGYDSGYGEAKMTHEEFIHIACTNVRMEVECHAIHSLCHSIVDCSTWPFSTTSPSALVTMFH